MNDLNKILPLTTVEDVLASLRELVRLARQREVWTQVDLARRSGVSSGLDPAPFRLRAGGGLDRDESEPIVDCVIEACRNLVLHGVSGQD